MKKELIVNFLPVRTTECIDEFKFGKYDSLILSTDDNYYIYDQNNKPVWFKVYLRIEDLPINKKYLEEEYPYYYNKNYYDEKNNFTFEHIGKNAITFTDLKNKHWSTLGYIIAKELFESKVSINDNVFDIDLKAPYRFFAKKQSDVGFDGSWSYWEGGMPKMQWLYINGIRLYKTNYRLKSSFTLNFPEDVLYPEKKYKIIK